MKTILVSFVIAAVCFTANAEKSKFQYVITDNDTLICSRFRVGYANTKCVLLSGEKKIIANADINLIGKPAVKRNSTWLMEKKPVYLDNKSTGQYALMELLDVQNGIKIFKYEYFNKKTQSLDLIFSFYKQGKLINTQTNPEVAQIEGFVCQYAGNTKNKELLTLDGSGQSDEE